MLAKKLILATTLVLMFTIGGVQAGGDPVKGKEMAQECGFCHGMDGKGDDEVPAVAGLDEAYVIAKIKAFKSGESPDESGMMQMYTEDLSEQDMADLAAYFATLEAD